MAGLRRVYRIHKTKPRPRLSRAIGEVGGLSHFVVQPGMIRQLCSRHDINPNTLIESKF